MEHKWHAMVVSRLSLSRNWKMRSLPVSVAFETQADARLGRRAERG